ncbi:MAG: peptide chain release factor-like protein [Candidatus Omnitrophica bacterium]|nr:peptide chain release factor-like protein [Candidatus Omnitrophota bacterium]
MNNIFSVSAEKEQQLIQRMQALGVDEKEIDESFVRSSGPGGQNVNKVSTCVVLMHRPTGLCVKCQESRSQSLNRFFARRLLLDKIEKKQKGFVQEERTRIEKIKRQKRKRSKRAKEKILVLKKQQSEKKQNRQKIEISNSD